MEAVRDLTESGKTFIKDGNNVSALPPLSFFDVFLWSNTNLFSLARTVYD